MKPIFALALVLLSTAAFSSAAAADTSISDKVHAVEDYVEVEASSASAIDKVGDDEVVSAHQLRGSAKESHRQLDHQWNNYQWPKETQTLVVINRMQSPFSSNGIDVWDNDSGFDTASASSPINFNTVPESPNCGSSTCGAESGKITVCNCDRGNTGWLGIAGIYATRGKNPTITLGYSVMNMHYFNMDKYKNNLWRDLVVCQEVGHNLGLGHTDENHDTSSDTCMDYQDPPGPNADTPNGHDYDQLNLMYCGSNCGGDDGGGGGGGGNGRGKPSKPAVEPQGMPFVDDDFGELVHSSAASKVFQKVDPDNPSMVEITHVTLVPGEGHEHDHEEDPNTNHDHGDGRNLFR